MIKKMYDGIANSPETYLTQGIDANVTDIVVDDAEMLLQGENLAVIGLGIDAETIKYSAINGNILVGCTRGFEGVAKSWESGTPIARNFTAYDHNTFKENVENLDNEKADKTELNTKVDKVSGKQLSTNDYTTVEKNKLAGIQAGAQVNAVTSVNSKTGAVTVSKSDVGLSNVDNVKQATKTEFDAHKAEKATQDKYGHIRLQDIPNPEIASQAEAEHGTDNTKMMTPLRTEQSMSKEATTNFLTLNTDYTGFVRYIKKNGILFIDGNLSKKDGSKFNLNDVLFTLPVGFRPTEDTRLMGWQSNEGTSDTGAVALFTMWPTGRTDCSLSTTYSNIRFNVSVYIGGGTV